MLGKLDAQDLVASPDHFATLSIVGEGKRQLELVRDRGRHLDDNLCAMSGYILNLALGSFRAFRQDQCGKITGPSDPELKRFEALWRGSNRKHPLWTAGVPGCAWSANYPCERQASPVNGGTRSDGSFFPLS